MAKKQIVTVSTNHVCPMVTGTTPHVGGPVIGPGCPGVLINGQPVALLGDTCVCCGPPDVIVQGCPGVLVDGVPVVLQDCMTAHGGVVPAGVPGVTVSSAESVGPLTVNSKKIPFPEIRTVDSVGAALSGNSKSLKKAKNNIEELQKESFRQEPVIYNVRWMKEDVNINDTEELEKIKVVASVAGIDEGETVDFKVTRKLHADDSEKTYELSGIVKDGEVEVVIDVEKFPVNTQDNAG